MSLCWWKKSSPIETSWYQTVKFRNLHNNSKCLQRVVKHSLETQNDTPWFVETACSFEPLMSAFIFSEKKKYYSKEFSTTRHVWASKFIAHVSFFIFVFVADVAWPNENEARTHETQNEEDKIGAVCTSLCFMFRESAIKNVWSFSSQSR